jgi:hypothetical protein
MNQKVYGNPLEYYSAISTKQEGANKTEDKPVVHYALVIHPPKIGQRAIVVPIDHPAAYLNYQRVDTSRVIAVAEDGNSFETLNTRYVYKELNLPE